MISEIRLSPVSVNIEISSNALILLVPKTGKRFFSVNDFIYGNDNSMSRYINIINTKCNNKCSNKNEFININEINKEYNNLCITDNI